MKKKFICRLSAMLIAVLCVCLLCVPAFASSTVIIPETTVTFDEESMAGLSEQSLFSFGYTYIVNWTGVEYICESQDCSRVFAGAVGLGNLSSFGFFGNGEPFAFLSAPGEGSVVYSLDGSTSATISVYQVVDPSQPVYIQPLVTIPESGTLAGSYSTELVEGETYIVSVNGTEYEVVCDLYSDLDLTGYRLTDGSTFVYMQYLEPVTGQYYIYAPAGAEFAVYQRVDMSEVIFTSITTYADALRIQLSSTSVIEVLTYIVGACVLGVFLWWCVRKAVKGIKSAYLRGKLRF